MCKDEFMDDELAGMVNYTDETVPAEMPAMEEKSHNTEANTEKRVKRVAEDCSDCPFTKKRSFLDRLWDMTKWIGICGGISMLMWWFWENGMMDMDAAFFCIVVSDCIGFFGGGINYAK